MHLIQKLLQLLQNLAGEDPAFAEGAGVDSFTSSPLPYTSSSLHLFLPT